MSKRPRRSKRAGLPHAAAGGTLDLNALYGANKPIKVLWGESEYELKHASALSPRDSMKLQGLQSKANSLKSVKKELNDIQAKQLEEITDTILFTLCPELAHAEMPFMVKAHTLTWYFEQVNGQAAAREKKVTSAA
jgi:hypothetical protein